MHGSHNAMSTPQSSGLCSYLKCWALPQTRQILLSNQSFTSFYFVIWDMWTPAVPTSQDRHEDERKKRTPGWGKLTLPASHSIRRRPVPVGYCNHGDQQVPPYHRREAASSPGLWGRQKAACSRKFVFLFSTQSGCLWCSSKAHHSGVTDQQLDPSSTTLPAR
ncbi:unnamed protein product [Nyctereutes procyonoides]|uniref:(raccoon dog) hypothetical protein n=1 Tax=Nyctereutes procyonoides TaxID=34880 RepID=A0A811Y3G5_NYCPR|nr:unnamed protein product [Nyctereutes procyonoides]